MDVPRRPGGQRVRRPHPALTRAAAHASAPAAAAATPTEHVSEPPNNQKTTDQEISICVRLGGTNHHHSVRPNVTSILGPPLASETVHHEQGEAADALRLTKLSYRLPVWPNLVFYFLGYPGVPVMHDFGFPPTSTTSTRSAGMSHASRRRCHRASNSTTRSRRIPTPSWCTRLLLTLTASRSLLAANSRT